MVELVVEIVAFQDLRRVLAFINDGVHRGLEGELHVLGQVVFDIDVAVPREVLAESEVGRIGHGVGEVAHLQMAEGAVHVGAERP